jgi:hypothetical protein
VLLSEKVMRVLILGTEKRPAEMIEADIKGEEVAEAAEPKPAVEKASAPEKPADAPSDQADEAASEAVQAAESEPKAETGAEAEATEKAAE